MSAADRLPPDQHAVGHALAVGQRDLDGPLAAGDAERGHDHVAQFGHAVGADNLAPVDDVGACRNLEVAGLGLGRTEKRTFGRLADP